ncbi:MAG: FecR domain-containing protein [Spartobacteria bacterium]
MLRTGTLRLKKFYFQSLSLLTCSLRKVRHHVVMKGIFLIVAILYACPLFAQDAPALAFPAGVEIHNATPQQLADSVSKAVREHPQNAAMIVREAMAALNNAEGNFSEIEKKRVGAVISAAIAAAPEVNSSSIVAAGAGIIPTLGAVVAQAAKAVPPEKNNSPTTASPSGMLLGNIRVQEVHGKGVKLVDANGNTSDLKEGEFIRQGVKIVTGPEGTATLIFENGSLVRVNQNTEFSIEKFEQDPFEAEGVDYKNIQSEPSESVTRTGVLKGEISFDVAKLKKSSRYEFVTPVGVSGIRGTGGFVKSTPKSQTQSASFGLFEGSATYTTAAGQTQVVNQNQAIGVGGPSNNFGVNTNPPDGTSSLAQANQGMSQARSEASGKAFQGAPPAQSAPAGPISSLSQAQQQTLQQAATNGAQAVAEAALQLAMQSPAAAADIAAAAADVAPALATTIATTFSSAFPGQASSISASVSATMPIQSSSIAAVVAVAISSQASSIASAVSSVVPAQAAQVAISVSTMAPSQSAAIAAAVSSSVPSQAAAIASAVSAALPARAAEIAASVATAFPNQAATIASAVASSVPSASSAIVAAVSSAVPSQAASISNAVGAQNSSETNTGNNGATNSSGQNTGILTPPTPSPTPRTSPNPNQPPSTTPEPTPEVPDSVSPSA